MTDIAQPTTGLAHRLVGNSNSTIGALIKRGFTGTNPTDQSDSDNKLIKDGNQKLTQEVDSDSNQDVNQESTRNINQKPAQSVSRVLAVTKDSTTADTLDVIEKVLDETEKTSPVIQSPIVDQLPTVNQASSLVAKPITSETVVSNPTAEGMLTQAMPQALNQVAMKQDSLQQSATSTTQKEAAESVNLDQIAVDAARGAQLVEVEPQPEIPPEVESYLQKVDERTDTAPQEIVIADGSQTVPTKHPYPSQPVVVLPITKDEEKEGIKKSPKFSIRWLVEWSRRLMKVFMGKIIYRPTEESTT